MPITSIISLNQIVDWFQNFQENHYFLKDFGFGEPYDIGTSRQMTFPYMWVTMNEDSSIATGSNVKSAIPDISFSIMFMDKINIQENYLDTNGFPSDNSQEILSDCLQYCQDLVTYIQQNWNQYGVLISQDVSFYPAVDETTDKATGIVARFVLRTRQVNCVIPESPTTIVITPQQAEFATLLTCETLIDCPTFQTYAYTGGTYNSGTTELTLVSLNNHTISISGITGGGGGSGSSGTSGTSGSNGTSGTSGTNGSSGTSGVSGTNGSSGTSGVSGTNGSSGTSGVNGTSGTSGTNGSSGTSGINGTSGTSGSNGTSGTNGSSGTSGVSGTNGSSGTSGINGTSGTSGVNGTSGTDGSSGTSGTSAQSYTGLTYTGGENFSITAAVYDRAIWYGDFTGGTPFLAAINLTEGREVITYITNAGSVATNITFRTGTGGLTSITDVVTDDGTRINNYTLPVGESITVVLQNINATRTGYIIGTGASGGSGSSGTSGTSGTSGVNGTNGTSGTNGSSGTSGVNGTNGSSGTSGTNGSSGTSGSGFSSPYVGNVQVTSGQTWVTLPNTGTTASSTTIDWNNGNVQEVVLGANTTFTFTNPQAGATYILVVRQSSSGSNTTTWPGTVTWSGAANPTMTPNANRFDVFTFIYDGSKYFGSYVQNFI